MKLITNITAAALLFCANQSQADILVYKGIRHFYSDLGQTLPATAVIYEIVDTSAHTAGVVNAYVQNGKKRQGIISPATYRFGNISLKGGKTASTYSSAAMIGSSDADYVNGLIHSKGLDTSLKVATANGGKFIKFPRVLTQVEIIDKATNSVGGYLEERSVIVFQQARTVAANDAALTSQQVIDALSDELKKAGFLP